MYKYLIEFLGTFFLVLTIALSANPLAIGVVLVAMVYMGGYISGAHYNPAVTLAVYLRGKIELVPALLYMLFQILGGFVAALVVGYVSGKMFTPAPGPEVTGQAVFLIEALYTFALATVVLHVATSVGTEDNEYYGLAIGFTVMAAAFAGGPVSGGVYNPAVAIGPILLDTANIGANTSHLLLYILGPLTGGALAGLTYNAMTGSKIRGK